MMRWFIGMQVVSLVEMAVHEFDKGGITAHNLDQARDIMLIVSLVAMS